MAENILAAACESETRKAAKRMRLEIYQSSQVPACCQLLGGVRSHPAGPRPRVQAGAGAGGEAEEPRHKGLADFRRASGLHLERQEGLQPGRNRSNLPGTQTRDGSLGEALGKAARERGRALQVPTLSPSKSGATVYPPSRNLGQGWLPLRFPSTSLPPRRTSP